MPFEKLLIKEDLFIALLTKNFNFAQNNFKNSDVRPSIPGVLLCFIFLRISLNSDGQIG